MPRATRIDIAEVPEDALPPGRRPVSGVWTTGGSPPRYLYFKFGAHPKFRGLHVAKCNGLPSPLFEDKAGYVHDEKNHNLEIIRGDSQQDTVLLWNKVQWVPCRRMSVSLEVGISLQYTRNEILDLVQQKSPMELSQTMLILLASHRTEDVAAIMAMRAVDDKLVRHRTGVEMEWDHDQSCPCHWCQWHGTYKLKGRELPQSQEARRQQAEVLTNLKYACEWGDAEAVAQILSSKVQLPSRWPLGRTPLHWAAQNGQAGVITAMHQDPRWTAWNCHRTDGATPLHEAAAWGSLDAVTTLARLKSDLAAVDNAGNTPLIRALWSVREGRSRPVTVVSESCSEFPAVVRFLRESHATQEEALAILRSQVAVGLARRNSRDHRVTIDPRHGGGGGSGHRPHSPSRRAKAEISAPRLQLVHQVVCEVLESGDLVLDHDFAEELYSHVMRHLAARAGSLSLQPNAKLAAEMILHCGPLMTVMKDRLRPDVRMARSALSQTVAECYRQHSPALAYFTDDPKRENVDLFLNSGETWTALDPLVQLRVAPPPIFCENLCLLDAWVALVDRREEFVVPKDLCEFIRQDYLVLGENGKVDFNASIARCAEDSLALCLLGDAGRVLPRFHAALERMAGQRSFRVAPLKTLQAVRLKQKRYMQDAAREWRHKAPWVCAAGVQDYLRGSIVFQTGADLREAVRTYMQYDISVDGYEVVWLNNGFHPSNRHLPEDVHRVVTVYMVFPVRSKGEAAVKRQAPTPKSSSRAGSPASRRGSPTRRPPAPTPSRPPLRGGHLLCEVQCMLQTYLAVHKSRKLLDLSGL
uniref:Uncharacterized protein n=1 Tax=Oxyrrhis marina TaxID=2969 RepID=A0A7S4GQ24_OXYMA